MSSLISNKTFIFLLFLISNINISEQTECGVPSIKPKVFGNTLTRVINGENAVQGSWPWIVSLKFKSNDGNYTHFCGGSLISEDLVLSAAHCLHFLNVNNFVIVVNTYNTSIRPNISNVYYPESFKIHSNYNQSLLIKGYDIVLIKLTKPVTLSDQIKLICLPNPGDTSFVYNKDVYTVGW